MHADGFRCRETSTFDGGDGRLITGRQYICFRECTFTYMYIHISSIQWWDVINLNPSVFETGNSGITWLIPWFQVSKILPSLWHQEQDHWICSLNPLLQKKSGNGRKIHYLVRKSCSLQQWLSKRCLCGYLNQHISISWTWGHKLHDKKVVHMSLFWICSFVELTLLVFSRCLRRSPQGLVVFTYSWVD